MPYVLLATVDLILSAWIIPPFAPCYGICSGSTKNLRWKSGLKPSYLKEQLGYFVGNLNLDIMEYRYLRLLR